MWFSVYDDFVEIERVIIAPLCAPVCSLNLWNSHVNCGAPEKSMQHTICSFFFWPWILPFPLVLNIDVEAKACPTVAGQ